MEPWIEFLELNHVCHSLPNYRLLGSNEFRNARNEAEREMCRRKFMFQMARPVTCQDGFSLSIQASSGHYCQPRFTLPYHRYTHFEVQAAQDVDLCPYAESYTSSIHPQVPRIVITRCIDAHGGLSDERPHSEYFDSNEGYFEMLAETDSA